MAKNGTTEKAGIGRLRLWSSRSRMTRHPGRHTMSGRWVSLVVMVMLAFAMPPVTAQDDAPDSAGEPYYQANPNATEPVANRLVVEAPVGTIKEWKSVGAAATDILVLGVEASTSGFALIDPYQHVIWQNQSSTWNGDVEFWNVQLLAGPYTVILMPDVQEGVDAIPGDANVTVVTTFSTNSLGAPNVPPITAFARGLFGWTRSLVVGDLVVHANHQYQSSASSKQSSTSSSSGAKTTQTKSSGSGGGECSGYSYFKQDETTKWTPLVIGHAPYLGSATAGSSVTSSKSGFVMAWGGGGSKSTTVALNIFDGNGGKTTGKFALAKWGYYQVKSNCGVHKGYTAKVFDWGSTEQDWEIWGTSRTTDADDVTSFTGSGYGSVTFDTRFQGWERKIGTASSASSTYGVTADKYSSIGGSVSFSVGAISAEAINLYSYKSSGNSYTYTFPAGPKCWEADYLGGGTSGAMAFRYVGAVTCS